MGPVNFITSQELSKRVSGKGKSSLKSKIYFPSVFCPHDTIKAARYLNFTTTPLRDALATTSKFFIHAGIYQAELKKAVAKLAKVGEM